LEYSGTPFFMSVLWEVPDIKKEKPDKKPRFLLKF
jgi:hypothetical protein